VDILRGMSYAAKLQRLCVLRGFDQAGVAAQFGLSRSSMSRILSGAQEPKLGLAFGLSRLFGVSLEYLADDELPVDSRPQSVVLSDDEWTILKLVRRLGTDEALGRLLAVEPQAELAAAVESERKEPTTAAIDGR
jgi:transcriptional regulator with XRE-family HTH domain